MTLNTAIDPAALIAALADVATPVLSALPGLTAAGTPHPVNGPSDLVGLGPGSQAFVVRLGPSLGGSLTIAVATPVISALSNGPLGAEAVTSALEAVVTDFVAGLSEHLGIALMVESPRTMEGDAALTEVPAAGDGLSIAAVELRGADAPLVTIVLCTGGGQGQDFQFGAINGQELANTGGAANGSQVASMEMLADVEMSVTAELGRTRMTVRNLLGLTVGSVVELDRSSDSAVDLFVNGTLIARGEVVIINEEFGVRVTEIVTRALKP
jgi:flagellar motor switch protein FliN/FliY